MQIVPCSTRTNFPQPQHLNDEGDGTYGRKAGTKPNVKLKAESEDAKNGTIHAKPKKMVKEDTAEMNKDKGAGRGKKYEDKTEDAHLENKSYKEVTTPLRRLLNKYEEGETRFQTLLRMMD